MYAQLYLVDDEAWCVEYCYGIQMKVLQVVLFKGICSLTLRPCSACRLESSELSLYSFFLSVFFRRLEFVLILIESTLL